ncbi:tRNA (adenosine(37)-N6)-threonylcarbamoyltransferase complex ATPase subunit type 1 TsaE [Salegentibacter chungangensis]|uniref:tRNA threonylcarbamoyladenosine biosynthesis protein TsaE n=1 Tax=Salegentibacter chungangensis TaxID=1335724 RepID=A0ABW3NU50_9FLAO
MSVTYTLSQIDMAVRHILDHSKSKTLLFNGEMGAGKTTLIKSLVKELGAKDIVSSPTFSLVNEYETPEGPIYHFDFYRIEDESEALDMGIEDYLAQDTWIFIEWPEKVHNLLGENTQILDIEVIDEKTRVLNIC